MGIHTLEMPQKTNNGKSNTSEFRDIIPSCDFRCPLQPVRIELSSSQVLLHVDFYRETKINQPENNVLQQAA
jgi:hypothetical protein